LDSHFLKKNGFRNAGATSILALATLILGSAALPTPTAFAQATNTSGSIQGTITDPSGAAIPGATVTITSSGTTQTKTVTTDSAGFYNSGPLNPGSYTIAVSAAGFSQIKATTVVQISSIATDNYKLTVGSNASWSRSKAPRSRSTLNKRTCRASLRNSRSKTFRFRAATFSIWLN
jgi:hypothetical protein